MRDRPFDLKTSKDLYKIYCDKPALLVKDHPELRPEVDDLIDMTINIESMDYFKEYNEWLRDWCFTWMEK